LLLLLGVTSFFSALAQLPQSVLKSLLLPSFVLLDPTLTQDSFSHFILSIGFPNEIELNPTEDTTCFLIASSFILIAHSIRLEKSAYTSAIGKIKCGGNQSDPGCQSCPINHQIDYKATVVARISSQ